MNNFIFSKLGCCVLAGALIPLGAAQAWDGSDIQEVSYPEASSAAPLADAQASSSPKGAQGPIRKDLTEDQATGHKVSAKAQKANARNFPYPSEDNHFPYADGG